MSSQLIDMDQYARRSHFNYFRSLPYPYVGVTVNVDVGVLLTFCREHGFSFYLMFLHESALAADGVRELLQRIRDGGIIEYSECPTSHTELLENGTYCYCTLHHHMPLRDYLQQAEAARQACRAKGNIEEDEDVESMVFISSLPWLHYSALMQPVAGGDESNPRITWGKYEEDSSGKVLLPVTLLAHLAQFYKNLEQTIQELIAEI